MRELLLASWQPGALDLPAGLRLVVADPGGDGGVAAVAWLHTEPEWVGGGADVYAAEAHEQWDDLAGLS